MKNITLSADESLIDAARRRAASEQTTLNAQFRIWLADYVGRERRAARARWPQHASWAASCGLAGS